MGLFDFSFGFSNNQTQVGLNKEDTAWLYQRQSDQWRANTEWYNKNGYSYLKEGLMNAGYNPLMALGASPLNGATVSGAAMDERSNASSFNSSGIPLGKQAYLSQMRNVNADTALKNAQTEENISRSNLENTQKILEDKRIPFQTKQLAIQTIGMELENIMKQTQMQNIKADTQLKGMQTNLTRSQISEINQNIELLKKNNIITDRQARWLKENPGQAQFVTGLSQWTSAIGNVFGSNASYNFKK